MPYFFSLHLILEYWPTEKTPVSYLNMIFENLGTVTFGFKIFAFSISENLELRVNWAEK